MDSSALSILSNTYIWISALIMISWAPFDTNVVISAIDKSCQFWTKYHF